MLENHPIFPERANISIAACDGARRDHPPHLGARRRPDPRLRHGRLRRRRQRRPHPPHRAARRPSRCRAARSPIEWRDDDHVMMTGPAEWEFSGDASTRRPARWARDTAGAPPDGASRSSPSAAASTPTSSEVMRERPRPRGRRLERRRGHRQHLRGDRRGGAPGAAGDPQGAPRQPEARDHRHRLRRADRPGELSPPCPRSISSSATRRS